MTEMEPEDALRYSFATAQRMLDGPVAGGERETSVDVGWFAPQDLAVEPTATAVARVGGPLEHLVGEVVRVRRRGSSREVLVYVFTLAAVADDLALSRRAFLALGGLWNGTLRASVAVIE